MQSFPHSEDYGHFLAELKGARLSVGLTQEELAKKLDVHQTLVSKAEAGIRRVDIIELRTWVNALNIPLVEFVIRLEARISRHAKLG